MMRGCNLSGGGTGYVKKDSSGNYVTNWTPTAGPVSGTHYLFCTNAEIDYYLAQGCNVFRLLFTWEALQPTPLAVIGDTAAAPNFKAYWTTFKSRVDYITSKGATCLIDVHGDLDAGFAAYYGNKVGSTYQGKNVSDLFENLWYQLGGIFKGNPLVEYGLTNEPHDLPAATWYAAAQQAILGIRKAGGTGWIRCPGVDWTGAGTWTNNSGPGWDAAKLTDPLNKLGIQVHMYFDANSGGGATDIKDAMIGVTRLKVAVDWARARGIKVFVAELGLAASNPLAQAAWKNTDDFMNANPDVIVGWTFWSAGPTAWWKNYQFTLCPQGTAPSAQMKLIASSLASSAPAPVPAPVPVPVDPTIALKAQITQLQAQLAAVNASLADANNSNAALQAKCTEYVAALQSIGADVSAVLG